jgi:hypothetical protein
MDLVDVDGNVLGGDLEPAPFRHLSVVSA